jgi:thymidylate synthase (FAD)
MKVNLVSYSQPTNSKAFDTGWRTLEDVIAYCARVSNPLNQNNTETSSKLLNYLIKHGH